MSNREMLLIKLLSLSDEQLYAFLTSPAAAAILAEQEDHQLVCQKAV